MAGVAILHPLRGAKEGKTLHKTHSDVVTLETARLSLDGAAC